MILRAFEAQLLNLTSLLTRPAKGALGTYTFILTIEAAIEELSFRDAISRAAEDTMSSVKFLGSYEADPEAGQITELILPPLGSLRGVDLDLWLARQG